MRIAHFVQRYPPALGGSEAYFARLGRHLVGQGHEVTVFTTAANDLEAFWTPRGRRFRAGVALEAGVVVRRYPLWYCPFQRKALKLLSLLPGHAWKRMTISCNPVAWGMWRDAGRTDAPFDVVHATAFPYGWVLASGLRLARRLGVPFVVTPFLHLGDPNNPNDRVRRAYVAPPLLSLLTEADRVFVQTTVERDALLDRGLGMDTLVVQGMGVETAGCTGGDRGRARAAWGVGSDEIVVGHLANLSREKGTADLLRAAALATASGARFRLVLAGPEMPNVRPAWERYRQSVAATRLGVLTDDEKRDFFAAIDLFAMPSRSDSFGLVFLEAWANGAPNLAYRAGGVAGVLRHGEDGLLVDCGDVPRLADALRTLIADAPLRSRLGEAGRRRLAVDYRWEDKLGLVEQAYEDLVGVSGLRFAPAGAKRKPESLSAS